MFSRNDVINPKRFHGSSVRFWNRFDLRSYFWLTNQLFVYPHGPKMSEKNQKNVQCRWYIFLLRQSTILHLPTPDVPFHQLWSINSFVLQLRKGQIQVAHESGVSGNTLNDSVLIFKDMRSEWALVELVHLHEVEVIGGEGRLEVVDRFGFPFILVHAISIDSGHLHELIDKLLLNADGIVGSFGGDSPLETVLLRMVLGHPERIVVGLNGWHLLNTLDRLARWDQFPELVDSFSILICFKSDCPTLMKPQQSFTSGQINILASC